MSKKEQLIIDIQALLNSHENISSTTINPDLLTFMDEDTLISIIGSLLDQKETHVETNIEWLEQFKQNKND
ncbi:hypothetical protein JHD49_07495 [Sulfurimonas sp. SAG-AH-194-C21]|nr:hypothetical protein [Sulfurimonas sp. SAG-AH-194-C21]MDF1883775.1 hypothetical protein [Sulfurimonas sp. SAG-AH-194-C21]